MKSYEEINAKIRAGKAVVVTAEEAVSYTHLDVYKRQHQKGVAFNLLSEKVSVNSWGC